MATSRRLPTVFALRRRTNNIPWASLVIISAVTVTFVNVANLTVISAFASSTFLLIFAAINGAALLLRREIDILAVYPSVGLLIAVGSWLALIRELFVSAPDTLYWLLGAYLAVAAGEFIVSRRGLLAGRGR